MSQNIKDTYTNMLEPFQTTGQWWIPGSDDKYNGILKYNPQEFVLELRILGNILPLKNGPVSFENVNIVNGLTVGGQYMTLLNCLYAIDSIKSPGYITCIIFPQYIFVGHCFESKNDIVFDEAIYSCINNEQLMGESGFKTDIQTENGHLDSYNLSYKKPEVIIFKLGEFDVTTNWYINMPLSGPMLNIQEKAGFVIKTSQHLSHEKFLKEPIIAIHTFLELIMDEQLPMRNIILKSTKIGEVDREGIFHRRPISLLWKQDIRFPLPIIKHHLQLMFTIKSISENINTIMKGWSETRNKFKPAHNLFFTVLRMQKDLTVENTFLNICHVLEAYHRIKSDETYMPSEEYLNLLDNIIGIVPEVHKQHIRQRLQYGNELNLRKRIKRIYDLLPEKIRNRLGKKQEFCDNIVNTRNYLTHYDERIRKISLSEDQMIQYNAMMIAVCKALFLLEASVSIDMINQKLGNFNIPETFSYSGK